MPLPTVAPWSPTACRFTEQQKPRVLVSLAAVGLFMAVGWPLIVYYTGWWGLVKFWLMPWLGYHFWMSEYCSPLLAARTCYAMLCCAAISISFTRPHLCCRHFHCCTPHGAAHPFQARWGVECGQGAAVWHCALRLPLGEASGSGDAALQKLQPERPPPEAGITASLALASHTFAVGGVPVLRHQCSCAASRHVQDSLVQPAGRHR